MPELKPRLFKIKPEHRQDWFDWCEMLNLKLQEQGNDTLRQENVSHEFFVNLEIGDSWYALGIAITNDGKAPRKADMSLYLNQRHTIVKRECLKFVREVNYGYFLTTVNQNQ